MDLNELKFETIIGWLVAALVGIFTFFRRSEGKDLELGATIREQGVMIKQMLDSFQSFNSKFERLAENSLVHNGQISRLEEKWKELDQRIEKVHLTVLTSNGENTITMVSLNDSIKEMNKILVEKNKILEKNRI